MQKCFLVIFLVTSIVQSNANAWYCDGQYTLRTTHKGDNFEICQWDVPYACGPHGGGECFRLSECAVLDLRAGRCRQWSCAEVGYFYEADRLKTICLRDYEDEDFS